MFCAQSPAAAVAAEEEEEAEEEDIAKLSLGCLGRLRGFPGPGCFEEGEKEDEEEEGGAC